MKQGHLFNPFQASIAWNVQQLSIKTKLSNDSTQRVTDG